MSDESMYSKGPNWEPEPEPDQRWHLYAAPLYEPLFYNCRCKCKTANNDGLRGSGDASKIAND